MGWGLSTCISVELPGDDEAEQMVSYMVSCLLVELLSLLPYPLCLTGIFFLYQSHISHLWDLTSVLDEVRQTIATLIGSQVQFCSYWGTSVPSLLVSSDNKWWVCLPCSLTCPQTPKQCMMHSVFCTNVHSMNGWPSCVYRTLGLTCGRAARNFRKKEFMVTNWNWLNWENIGTLAEAVGWKMTFFSWGPKFRSTVCVCVLVCGMHIILFVCVCLIIRVGIVIYSNTHSSFVF